MTTSPRLSRAQWGAAPVPAGRPVHVATTTGTALHWVGPALGNVDHGRCASILRGIQKTHMAGEWYDIAYNEAVCRHGVRFECRGYHVQTGANGTTTANRNNYAILALVGASDSLPLAMIDALADAFDAYRARAGAGDRVTGHRDHTSTTCPGAQLYAMVRAGRFSPHPPPTPPPTPVPIAEERDDMMLIRVTEKSPNPVYLADGINRRWFPTAADRDRYVAGRKTAQLPALVEVKCPTEDAATAAFGVIVGPVAP